MDYEKLYKEAFERARAKYAMKDQPIHQDLADIFPELAESEEEKTKRMLHTIANKMSQHLRDIFTEEEFECFDAWSNAWLEKQSEQKPADKVEPKFKVGDTLINSDGEKRTIVEVGEDYYKFDDCSILHFKAQDKWEVVKEPKECMYSKDNYTDEDRKVLCDGCEEECKFNKKEEPVSEDLEAAIDNYLATYFGGEKEKQEWPFLKKMAIYFANWQKQQMLAKAVDVEVKVDAGGYPYIPQMELYDYEKDIPLAKEGDKYKVILIKE